MNSTQEDRIRELAHQLWVENGSPENMAEHFWLVAERQFAEQSAAHTQIADKPAAGDIEKATIESGRAE